jgi:hypothetical protein
LNGKEKAQGFLVKDPKEWWSSPLTGPTKGSVSHDRNDSAWENHWFDAAVELIMTKNEERQFLLRLVKCRRKTYPPCFKPRWWNWQRT